MQERYQPSQPVLCAASLVRMRIAPKSALQPPPPAPPAPTLRAHAQTPAHARLQVEHVKAEKDALSVVSSPFIVTLFYSFQDDDYLYLIMEYLPGGDVMTLLIRKDILSEDEVRFYIAETVLALEAIHNAGYLHRCAAALRLYMVVTWLRM
jgi:serine/threonine protein kinase